MAKILRVLVLALVFTLFAAHHAWGEDDCHMEKTKVLETCKKTIRIGIDYEPPSLECCLVVQTSDMVCICHILSIPDQDHASVFKLVKLAADVGSPYHLKANVELGPSHNHGRHYR
uniref:Bifunctional inhibitor/plant lipid transfer protein/seed storage helical domain-containing protein n=1 Tax=Setaria viridis TaxID=4556 RepID=A0A4U6TSE2_SETVI|nr:hypothetical protein SEVIR_7G144800v2 [Setaria viridis]